MRKEREQQVQDDDAHRDEPTTDQPAEDDEFTSAQTRAGSNLPNAAGHRGDGSHE